MEESDLREESVEPATAPFGSVDEAAALVESFTLASVFCRCLRMKGNIPPNVDASHIDAAARPLKSVTSIMKQGDYGEDSDERMNTSMRMNMGGGYMEDDE